MKKIIFVTSNKGKIASVQRDLKNIKVLAYNADLIEPRSDDIKEIAKQKVLQAYKIVKKPCIALDSGFFISELNGFPKAYVNHMLETIGIKGVLKLMEGISNRYCEFKSCLAYYDGINLEFFESKSPGTISESIKGNENENKWSDLWYIFKPEKFNKTLAEFSEDDFKIYDELKEDSYIRKFGIWYEGIHHKQY
ncbi:non-canonical purine NTP pyrophosphatase [Clostridium tagluense]|uniref:Non-canonical purine NTP pyrophosphatase n=1 Tax=Clostridium tagluense TaxID=360422 RepID=A0A401ULV0_9CLOT|nr:non-canonical purine NTP pyrophosphatase [Clostridium tagluense]GCD10513.1 non-canonical purine NTP pyrophosphatase [Clostridium tagluense]